MCNVQHLYPQHKKYSSALFFCDVRYLEVEHFKSSEFHIIFVKPSTIAKVKVAGNW